MADILVSLVPEDPLSPCSPKTLWVALVRLGSVYVCLPFRPLLGGTISVLLATLSFRSNTWGGSYMDIFDFQREIDAQKATVL